MQVVLFNCRWFAAGVSAQKGGVGGGAKSHFLIARCDFQSKWC